VVPNIDRKTLVFKIFLIAGDDGNSDCSLHDQIKFFGSFPNLTPRIYYSAHYLGDIYESKCGWC
jgi:hypothetical protein